MATPTPTPNPMADDEKLIKLASEIQKRKDELMFREKYLRELNNENEYLENIKKDYQQYNSYIVNEKQKQMETMNMLSQYLDDLQKKGILSNNNLNDALQEQTKLKNELNVIKNSLNTVLTNTQTSS